MNAYSTFYEANAALSVVRHRAQFVEIHKLGRRISSQEKEIDGRVERERTSVDRVRVKEKSWAKL